MIPDWETDTVLIADVLLKRHGRLARQLIEVVRNQGLNCEVITGPADFWIRDYAPVQVSPPRFIQFRYRPDYLRDSHPELITGPGVLAKLPWLKHCLRSTIGLDGGNIVGTQTRAILTDKIFGENPRRNRTRLRQELKKLLQVERLIVIPTEPFDSIGHADGMVRFLQDDLVAVNDYSECHPRFGERLERVLTRNQLRVVRFPYHPSHEAKDGIESAVGNYVNFLRVRGLTIVPSYRASEDCAALNLLTELLPQDQVMSLPCRELAQEGGVLNCVSWTIRRQAE